MQPTLQPSTSGRPDVVPSSLRKSPGRFLGWASVWLLLLSWSAGFADTVTVLNNGDSGAGSLRQAIADVSANGLIQFDPALTDQTITLTSGELVIDKSLI